MKKRMILGGLLGLSILLHVACSEKAPAVTNEPGAEESAPSVEKGRAVVLATTTSTHDSGLLDHIIPDFEKWTGIRVKVVAVGTGQALELGRRGEADLLLVHAPDAETAFMEAGHGANRRAVMHNDFVIVGPGNDPAKLKGIAEVPAVLGKIAEAKAAWVSRGDRSGTHMKEQFLWNAAGISPQGDWFVESGQGMGATLRIASERQAYTLADRGTYLAVENLELAVLVQGSAALFNPYHVIEVAHQYANREGAKRLADHLVAPQTQQAIAGFKVQGTQLFYPDAVK